VRTVKILITLLLLGTPTWVVAQSALATGAPEAFGATAQATAGAGSVSGTIDVRVRRYTPDFDRTAMETALRQGGYAGFLTALAKAPEVGQVVLGGGQIYSIRYARERVEPGLRTIILVTDKPVFFLGGGGADAKPRAGFAVGVLEIKMDGSGRGQGTMAGAARVRPDGNGGVLLDDYAETPIVLNNITRKPL